MVSNENELLTRITKGDEKAFEILFRTYYKVLCNYSFKILKDSTAAEEIVQDIFFHIWEKKQFLDRIISVKSYLYKAAHNNSIKQLRHEKIVTEHQDWFKNDQENSFDLQENYAEIFEISHIILETINSVPERTREIFILKRDEGLKYKEIAERLKISVKTVEAHMTQILKLLREHLKDYLLVIIICSFFLG